jgi:hypothetical protein
MSNDFEQTIVGLTTRKSTLKPGLNFANPKNDYHNHLLDPLSNIIASCRMGEEDLEESLRLSGYGEIVEYKRAMDDEADLITRLVTEYLTDNTGDMEKFTDKIIDRASDIIQFDKSFSPDEALQMSLGMDLIEYEKAKETKTETETKGPGVLSGIGGLLMEGAKGVAKHVSSTLNVPVSWTQHNGKKSKGTALDAATHAIKHRGTENGIKDMVGHPTWLNVVHNVVKYLNPYSSKKKEEPVKTETPKVEAKLQPKVEPKPESKPKAKRTAKPITTPPPKEEPKPVAKKKPVAPVERPAAKAPATRGKATPIKKPVQKKASFRASSLEGSFLDILKTGSRGVKGIWGSSSDD